MNVDRIAKDFVDRQREVDRERRRLPVGAETKVERFTGGAKATGAINTSGMALSLGGLAPGQYLVSVRIEVSQTGIDVADGEVEVRYVTWQVSGRRGTDTIDSFTRREPIPLQGLLSGHTETVNFNPCGHLDVGDSARVAISSSGSWAGTAEIRAVAA